VFAAEALLFVAAAVLASRIDTTAPNQPRRSPAPLHGDRSVALTQG
jgi:hypothetical protein